MRTAYPKAQIIAEVNAAIDRVVEENQIRKAVIAALEKFDGKKITKAVATAVEKMLPGYTVSYSVDGYGTFSSFYIRVWGQGLTYDHRESINLPQMANLLDYEQLKTDLLYRIERATAYREELRVKIRCIDNLLQNFADASRLYEKAQADFGALSGLALHGN